MPGCGEVMPAAVSASLWCIAAIYSLPLAWRSFHSIARHFCFVVEEHWRQSFFAQRQYHSFKDLDVTAGYGCPHWHTAASRTSHTGFTKELCQIELQTNSGRDKELLVTKSMA
jgi:hypothetical protein